MLAMGLVLVAGLLGCSPPESMPQTGGERSEGLVPTSRGEMKVENAPPKQPAPTRDGTTRPRLTSKQEELVIQAARQRLAAAVRAETPESTQTVLRDVAEIPVYGVVVSLKRGGRLRSCCIHVSLAPLWHALDRAVDRAANKDPRFPPISPDELPILDMEVWLLWNLQLVSTHGENRVSAVTVGKHGLQISRGTRHAALLPSVAVQQKLDAKAFLRQVCLKAGLPPDAWQNDASELMTFEGYAIRGSLGSGSATAPGPSTETGPAAVAGIFYPGMADELRRALDGMLPKDAKPKSYSAVMVPHAGWVYSGRLAAEVFSRVKIPERVIILGPRHRAVGASWAVAPHRIWSLPGPDVESDPKLAEYLAKRVTGLELDARAHQSEHAIEVQLPILARLAPHARVVGITIHGGDLASLRRFGKELAEAIREMPERPLLVISSDMNHFSPDKETRRLDRLALNAIEARDPVALYQTVKRHHITMCGVLPAVIVLETLNQLDTPSGCELVGHKTSADAFGDTRSAVGYAGVLFR